MQIIKPKERWELSARCFQGLLSWFDEGTNSNGQTYLEIRRRLVAYFDRKNCGTPDELADETLNRVARRLEEEGFIETDAPAKYCYIVARFVFMEHLRETHRKDALLGALQQDTEVSSVAQAAADDETAVYERKLYCLEQCSGKLEALQRQLIVRYYAGQQRVRMENRRALAQSLGITVNALTIRACRIRDKLEACVRECVVNE